MSDVNFTPCPWRVFGKSGVVGRYEDDEYGCVEVCRVGDYADKGLLAFNKDRWEADANLISAAPYLYEALKDMITSYERYGSPLPLEQEVENALSALSKARGEQ